MFCVDFSRLAKLADSLGYAYDPSSLQDYVTGATDTALAAQTAVLAARSLGIDSLITNATHRGDGERFFSALGLPARYCVPQLALVLGYAAKKTRKAKGRLAGAGVVHYGKYRPLSDAQVAEMVAWFDQPASGMGTQWKRSRRFGHYLDWFFGKWCGCPRKGQGAGARGSGSIEALLARAGFAPGDVPVSPGSAAGKS